MDSDAIVLQNPLEHFHPDYDVQVGSQLQGREEAYAMCWVRRADCALWVNNARTCHMAAHPGPCLLLPQGLSDWSGPELPRVGEVLHRSCGLYALVPDHRVGVGGWMDGPAAVSCGCITCPCVSCRQQQQATFAVSNQGTDSTQQQPETCSRRGRGGTSA
jgi:hypothetical protein